MDDYMSNADANAINWFEQLCAVLRKAKLKFGKMKWSTLVIKTISKTRSNFQGEYYVVQNSK